MLWVTTTIISCRDINIYWRSSDCPYQLNVDFNDFMKKGRFMAILRWHIFCIPDGELFTQDPLYQIRSFLTAFNDHLVTAMKPGKYKKIPRKPHPIGQEYKTIADNVTAVIMRLDVCGDPVLRVPARREDRAIVACVKRLTEPWFYSGRTIVADS
ncbi:unnamed protein product [Mucor hiemalis]